MNNDLGLKKRTVKLVNHNPNWEEHFEKEKKLLLKTFPNILKISHGGSTVIPNIPAKPIIDLFAVVKSLKEVEPMVNNLEKLGYDYVGERGVPERLLAVKKGPLDFRTHHLHFVEETSNEWKNHLLLKNYFLKYPEVVTEYAKLKVELGEKFGEDRGSYTSGKESFIESVLEKAGKEPGLLT